MSSYINPQGVNREIEKAKLISETDTFADRLNGEQQRKKHFN